MKKDPDSGAYRIYIMRHGIAQERGGKDAPPDDAQRKLTPEGREKTREIAKGLKRVGFAVDWIVTSPLVRAVETAEIVRDTLKLDAPFDHCDVLRPGLSAQELMKFLCKRPERHSAREAQAEGQTMNPASRRRWNRRKAALRDLWARLVERIREALA